MKNSNNHFGSTGASKRSSCRFASKEAALKFCATRKGSWEKSTVSFDATPGVTDPWVGTVSRSADFVRRSK